MNSDSENRLSEAKLKLETIEERIKQHVLESEVPLELVLQKKKLEKEIDDLEESNLLFVEQLIGFVTSPWPLVTSAIVLVVLTNFGMQNYFGNEVSVAKIIRNSTLAIVLLLSLPLFFFARSANIEKRVVKRQILLIFAGSISGFVFLWFWHGLKLSQDFMKLLDF